MNLEEMEKNRSLKAFDNKLELSRDNIKDITDNLKEAGTKDDPFPMTNKDGDLQVIGDATKIDRDIQEYDIVLMLDKKEFNKEEAESINIDDKLKEISTMYMPKVKRQFKFISPQKRSAINAALTKFMIHFYKIEDGKVVFNTEEDFQEDNELRLYMDTVAMNAIHESVNEILAIPEKYRDKVQSASAVQAIVEFIGKNPDLIAEIHANFS